MSPRTAWTLRASSSCAILYETWPTRAAPSSSPVISSGEIARMSDDIGVLATGHLVYEGALSDFADPDDERAMEKSFLAAVTGSGRRTGTEARA